MIEVTLNFCTVHNGIPYGLAKIYYHKEESKFESFNGICFFTDGKLHKGPFTCRDEHGWVSSFSMMLNGRPGDSHYMTRFFPRGYQRHLNSLHSLIDVEGM